ncbi:Transcriptional regulator containing HTH domain, ArsR family [Natrarchaeobaculum sulfurireducens]|uniref:Transcriptional regulator containing HTH domain, ArsR family n=2 Tax=Natrarchaeobaculum sulfurireducens TaxID=2044521 RepID=A0A346PGL9_9EURY|nr:Transcriptional regulator containing HTH domain,ArsR family [Natrarchaeobaculum sulfurireducens]AXR81283.1 Transcriptional regulator containing HTH domain, ArsR family [Natrarchaeobaculum sulfurireducens]
MGRLRIGAVHAAHMSATEHDSDVEGEQTTITDLSPSAKLVYKVLEYEGELTQEEIATESRLCARTVRYALGKLEDSDLIASRVCLDDARQSNYWIRD